MFKNIYTTHMSGKESFLKKRFDKILSKRFSKTLNLICTVVIFMAILGCNFVLAGFGEEKTIVETTGTYEIVITCNGKKVNFSKQPIYNNGDVYVPLEELFERANVDYKIVYSDDEIHLRFIDGYDVSKDYEMKIGEKKLTGFELGFIGETLNAPIKIDDTVYVPMEFVEYMWFDNTQFEYYIDSDNSFAEKIKDAIKYEQEAHDWTEAGYTQYDLNMKAHEAMRNWDELLNLFLAELSQEEYDFIGQNDWIKARESYAERQSAVYQGGSMQSMVHSYARARMTRKRCEQLLLGYVVREEWKLPDYTELLLEHVVTGEFDMFDSTEILVTENPEDIKLKIYYWEHFDEFILKRFPWTAEYLKEHAGNKIVVDGNTLLQNLQLFENIDNAKLMLVDDDSYLDCELYYVLESKTRGKLLEVSFSTSSGCIIVNGEKIERNSVFYELILPFLSEDDAQRWIDYALKPVDMDKSLEELI